MLDNISISNDATNSRPRTHSKPAVSANALIRPPLKNSDFFRFVGFPLNIVAMHPDNRAIDVKTCATPRQLQNGLAWARQKNAEGRGIFVEVNAGKIDARNDAGSITHLRVVAADTDWKDGRSKADCIARSSKLSLRPTITIDTGGGFHKWYFYEQPLAVSPDIVARHAGVCRSLASQVGGDNVHDLPRMLRAPGFINYPSKKKRAAGRTPVSIGVEL